MLPQKLDQNSSFSAPLIAEFKELEKESLAISIESKDLNITPCNLKEDNYLRKIKKTINYVLYLSTYNAAYSALSWIVIPYSNLCFQCLLSPVNLCFGFSAIVNLIVGNVYLFYKSVLYMQNQEVFKNSAQNKEIQRNIILCFTCLNWSGMTVVFGFFIFVGLPFFLASNALSVVLLGCFISALGSTMFLNLHDSILSQSSIVD